MGATEPMLLGSEVPQGGRRTWKVLASLFLFAAAGCMAFWSGVTGQQVAAADAPMSMAMQGMGLKSAPLRMQLSKYGIGSTPLERATIIAIDEAAQGTCRREVSVKAKSELSKEIASMDTNSKEQVSKLVSKVVARAETVKDMPGIQPPLGFFDPLGISADLSEGKLLFYREAELKHGRICMLATLGIAVSENFHPLAGGNIDVPAALTYQETALSTFWPLAFVAIAIPEFLNLRSLSFNGEAKVDGRIPGDLGFDPLGYKPKKESELKEFQSKELLNGRLAMISAIGMIAQELVTGKKIF